MNGVMTKDQEAYWKVRLLWETHQTFRPGFTFMVSEGEEKFRKAVEEWKRRDKELWEELSNKAKALNGDLGEDALIDASNRD